MSDNFSSASEILRSLIRCKSVTPLEGGALTFVESFLQKLGFTVHRVTFSDNNTPDVENLYARIGNGTPNFCFAGHVDVVTEGDEKNWKKNPFAGDIVDNEIIGRGAVDMKGGIACFLCAVEQYLSGREKLNGSISLLITGDEEGPAINGTKKLLKWADERGEKFDICIVGEPVNSNIVGDTIKIGRRGSVSAVLTVNGVQGHVAYPELADNPVRGMLGILNSLLATPLDEGTQNFQPSNIEVTTIDIGNRATNVIAGKAKAGFNIRFNDFWSGDTIRKEVLNRLKASSKLKTVRKDSSPLLGDEKSNSQSVEETSYEGSATYQSSSCSEIDFSIEWIGNESEVFLNDDKKLINFVTESIVSVTGITPDISTGGGTSDARFIKDYCPVIEFGLVGQTMHQIDERVPIDDLKLLSKVYYRFLDDYFNKSKH